MVINNWILKHLLKIENFKLKIRGKLLRRALAVSLALIILISGALYYLRPAPTQAWYSDDWKFRNPILQKSPKNPK